MWRGDAQLLRRTDIDQLAHTHIVVPFQSSSSSPHQRPVHTPVCAASSRVALPTNRKKLRGQHASTSKTTNAQRVPRTVIQMKKKREKKRSHNLGPLQKYRKKKKWRLQLAPLTPPIINPFLPVSPPSLLIVFLCLCLSARIYPLSSARHLRCRNLLLPSKASANRPPPPANRVAVYQGPGFSC